MWASSGHLDFFGCVVRNCHDTPVYVDETGGNTASAAIIDCQFLDNTSEGGAGALVVATALGGATIRGCLFQGNINTGSGGGGLALGSGRKLVEDCVFIENGAMGSNGQGGGMHSGYASPFVARNNTFVGNYKTENALGGSAAKLNFGGLFENNIVVGSHGGSAITYSFGVLTTNCNVYWDNPQGVGVPLSLTDREVDPEFCDPEEYDLRLREGSPCLPEDPLGCGLTGALGQGCAPISLDSKSWGAIKGLYR